MINAAVAAFVKTPGLSGIKTRLAADCGVQAAADFYALAIACVEELLTPSDQITPFWAVAEVAGRNHPLWRRFPTLSQGDGGLGERLHRVYSALLEKFSAVILIGADSPQLAPGHFSSALQRLEDGADFVFGPAADGGFYLLAGREPIPHQVFTAVEYSAADTMAQLQERLSRIGRVEAIQNESDVDTGADLLHLMSALSLMAKRTPSQTALMEWLRERSAEVQER
jgi:uncharacterized protein